MYQVESELTTLGKTMC